MLLMLKLKRLYEVTVYHVEHVCLCVCVCVCMYVCI